uniref:acyltransferase-like protein At1g54570, chloroplastic n=1 Tax=Erigeron canadensis TaxID=72917 RepID=UPI001CB9AA86|nr:acyltransferase-like protein At1g54570, chloroplastic [Erigeron canadensis]
MALIMNYSGVPLFPLLTLKNTHSLRSLVFVKSIGGKTSVLLSPESFRINEGSYADRKNIDVATYDDKCVFQSPQNVPEELEPLWDDGYGTQTIKDFAEISMDLIKNDRGPPRWFCPATCGFPLKESPTLLYLPGIDGTGAGLVVHEKGLGKLFHVQCLHIPVSDRTALEGLISIVEETVLIEHYSSPNKPIYLLGDSLGGSLALAVAARNPTIDLMLILANPATSYERSSEHPLIPLVRDLPMSPLLSDFVKMTTVGINGTNHSPFLWQLFGKFLEDVPLQSVMAKILPNDTLEWRLKLIQSAAAYVNSRFHAITAQVLVLASGKDNFIPSKTEAQRLKRLLKNCHVRVFEENGHTILLESNVNLLSVIKTNQIYRRSLKHDIFKDFYPASMTEFKSSPMEKWWFRLYTGTTLFSTMEDGKIVRGLAGIPDDGPVLVVGNHMLWGFDAFSLVPEFLREKKITLHGLAHPESYQIREEDEYLMIPLTDIHKIFGTIPVSARNLFKLLSRNSFALLYPGGARESLHRKGESCKLFWPDKQEFVRMAVKLGATIIPYGAVGEDDLTELLIDLEDMKRIPFLDQKVKEFNQGRKNLRAGHGGEIAKQPLHIPIFLPKLPGRLYFMFGKPIQTKGKEHMLNDKDYLRELYLQIKCDVEKNIAYLLTKREKDPYRGIFDRLMWVSNHGSLDNIPSFEP